MMSIGTPLRWSLFAAFVLVALVVDFFAMEKQGAHKVSMKEAGVWSLVWVGVSAVGLGSARWPRISPPVWCACPSSTTCRTMSTAGSVRR